MPASLPGLPTIQFIQCLFGQSWIVGRARNEATLFAFMMVVLNLLGHGTVYQWCGLCHNLAIY